MTSSIYTRNGDAGLTSLADGTRVTKGAFRLEAYGTIDEANANLGKATAILQELLDDASDSPQFVEPLNLLQSIFHFLANRLFNCSSILAHGNAPVPETVLVTEEDVLNLERSIDYFEQSTGGLKGFVLCGGVPLAAQLHITRTVMRRAERCVCRLFEEAEGDRTVLKFINRASDFLFSASRYANYLLGESDVLWQKQAVFPHLPNPAVLKK